MPIAALPAHTVRAIGSSQALTDSASLVKELVDNAIDGRASTISVEISANTLNEIRVKDNGHGINPDDRPMACLRHCTSKIRGLDELRDIGGRSLGFRGVALASAAEMSGVLTISTRIEGEEIASEMRFDRQGHVASEKRTSLPVGTTVRVERFLETMPVRRQAAEKTPTKTLGKIRRMMQAYAIARPQLRLSLKVLKAKDEKSNWKYPVTAGVSTPKLKNCASNAVMDVMGKKVTNQCLWMNSTWSSTGEHIATTSDPLNVGISEEPTYAFEAVLAKPNCDSAHISNMGQYLSVDSRPVSCARGTLKQIVSIYKTYLQSANTSGDHKRVTDPFLCLNIVCPMGSYDANVEPAKDDVLFTDAEIVISLVEKFFKSTYGELRSSPSETAVAKSLTKPQGIELLLAKKKSSAEHKSVAPKLDSQTRSLNSLSRPTLIPTLLDQPSIVPADPEAPPPRASSSKSNRTTQSPRTRRGAPHEDEDATSFSVLDQEDYSDANLIVVKGAVAHTKGSAWKASMYGEEDDDDDERENLSTPLPQSAIDDTAEEEIGLRSVRVSNPWAFAKLNAPFRPPRRDQQQHIDTEGNNQLPTPRRQKGDFFTSTDQPPDCTRPTSPVNHILPTPTRTQHQAVAEPTTSSPSPFPFPLRARGKRKADRINEDPASSHSEADGRGSLDAWVQKSLISHREDHDVSGSDNEVLRGTRGPADILQPGPFVSARSLPRGTPLNEIPDISSGPRRKAPPRKHQQDRNLEGTYRAPVNDPDKVWFDVGEKPKRKHHPQKPRTIPSSDPDSLMLRDTITDESIPSSQQATPTTSIHPDLAITLDYETRKQLATQQHRASLRRPIPTPNPTIQKTSPHKNRQKAAIAALHTDASLSHPPTQDNTPTLDPTDPRAYLIRLNQQQSPNKPHRQPLRRHKTSLLPLETLPQHTYIGDLIQPLPTKALDFETLLNANGVHDEYIRHGSIANAFDEVTEAQIQMWEMRLKEMVKERYRIESMDPGEEMEGELDCDLGGVLKLRQQEEGI